MRIFRGACLSVLISLVIACSHTPPKLQVTMRAADYLNPNQQGQANPIVVEIFQLKNGWAFSQADYQALTLLPSQTLANDLLDRRQVELQPAHSVSFKQPINEETKYLGIIAGYQHLQQANWRRILAISKLKSHHIQLTLSSSGIILHQPARTWLWR